MLDGDTAPHGKRAQQPPVFDPCLLRTNGWMHQDATWYEGRPRPRRHCVRWEPSSLSLSERSSAAPHSSAHIYCGQTAAWIKMPLGMEVGLGPGHIVLDGDPASPPQKAGTAPQFRPMSTVAKRSSISATAEHLLHSLSRVSTI